MGTRVANTSIQLPEQTPGAGTAADTGHVRVDATSTPGVRITDDAGGSYELTEDVLDKLPTWDTADWFGTRGGAATIYSVGMTNAFAGTLSQLAPSASVARLRPMVNLVHAAAAIASNAHVSTNTYNATDPIYNPDLYMTLETRAAADLLNERGWWGFFSALPSNIAPSTLTTRHFGFTYDAGASAGDLKVQYNDAGTTTQSDPLVGGVPTAFPLTPNLALRLRVKLTPTECYWYINGVEVYHVVFGAALVTPMPLGVSMSWITTVAVAKNIGFGDFMVIHRR